MATSGDQNLAVDSEYHHRPEAARSLPWFFPLSYMRDHLQQSTSGGKVATPVVPRARFARLVGVALAGVCLLSAVFACGSAGQPPGGAGETVTATLVVPRFNGGSVPTVNTSSGWDAFWYNRGFPADQLRLGDTYAPLLAGLRQSSGSESLVIGASYDWRMPAAPPQVQADGLVTGLLAHWNDPSSAATYGYAVDYLRYWLIQAMRANPGRSVVNVVAHSTGVSIVRAYLQSDAYGKSVLAPDGSRVTLPTIGKLLLAVPPEEGAPFVWNVWNGNFASFVGAERGADIFRGYSQAYQHVLAGGAITGPGGDITKASLTGKGLSRQVRFLRQYNPLLRLVLPTYPFLYPLASPAKAARTINDSPDSSNELLLDLNAGSSPGSNPWSALAGQVVVTYPVHVLAPPASEGSQPVPTDVTDQTRKGAGGAVVPFTQFSQPKQQPIPTVPGQTWYQEIFQPDAGDGAFPLRTMQGMFFTAAGEPDPGIHIQQWGNGPSPAAGPKQSWTTASGNLSHNLFIENPDITTWISRQFH